MFLYATNKWSLIQSLACWLLYKEGFIEPPQLNEKPYDILLHQALSITKGHSGIKLNDLINQLKNNFCFKNIDKSEIEEIVNHLIKYDLLEKIRDEIIIGIEGERIVNSQEFYSVFKTEENFKVVNSSNVIGEIPFSPQIREDENILLAAKIWKIKFVDFKSKKIEVIPAPDGKKPKFFGGGGAIHPKIREKMFEILYSINDFEFLDQPSFEEIQKMRKEFSAFHIQDFQVDRPLLISGKYVHLYTFSGTRLNRTLHFALNFIGIKNILDDSSSMFDIEISKDELLAKWSSLIEFFSDIDSQISNLLETSPTLLDFSKWGFYLPPKYQVELVKDKYFDLNNTENLINSIRFIEDISNLS